MSEYFTRGISWLNTELEFLKINTNFFKSKKNLQLLGEIAVLQLSFSNRPNVRGEDVDKFYVIFEKIVDKYVKLTPFKVDTRLYRLTCLLERAVLDSELKSALRVDYLTTSAINQFFSNERTPWEIYSFKFSCEGENGNYPIGLPDDKSLLNSSLFRYSCPPQMLSKHSIYAITHIVLFSTYFGMNEESAIHSNSLSYLNKVKSILEQTTLLKEPDLSAELILSLICIGERDGNYISKKVKLVMEQFNYNSVVNNNFVIEENKQIFSYNNYHTVLVFLLISVSLSK